MLLRRHINTDTHGIYIYVKVLFNNKSKEKLKLRRQLQCTPILELQYVTEVLEDNTQ